MRITLQPISNESLKRDGFVAYLNIGEGKSTELNAYAFLTREQVQYLYAAAHDILGDLPKEERVEVTETWRGREAVAFPEPSEHAGPDNRERSEAINRALYWGGKQL